MMDLWKQRKNEKWDLFSPGFNSFSPQSQDASIWHTTCESIPNVWKQDSGQSREGGHFRHQDTEAMGKRKMNIIIQDVTAGNGCNQTKLWEFEEALTSHLQNSLRNKPKFLRINIQNTIIEKFRYFHSHGEIWALWNIISGMICLLFCSNHRALVIELCFKSETRHYISW